MSLPQPPLPPPSQSSSSYTCLRLYISAPSTHAGKTTLSLLLLQTLLLPPYSYHPSSLAYIKPATQCEDLSIIEVFCKRKGIEKCVCVGPIVYYSGFTRAHIDGTLSPSVEELMICAQEKIEVLAKGAKVLIIDGVGFPAVGSITGSCNGRLASLFGGIIPSRSNLKLDSSSISTNTEVEAEAEAGAEMEGLSQTLLPSYPCPVLLISPPGVGLAIDSHNLSTAYFKYKYNVSVLGSIFNKLPLTGYYSVDNCKIALDRWFDTIGDGQGGRCFGYVPLMEELVGVRETGSYEELVKGCEMVEDGGVIERFGRMVDVEGLLEGVRRVMDRVRNGNGKEKGMVKEGKENVSFAKGLFNTLGLILPPQPQPQPLLQAQSENSDSGNNDEFSRTSTPAALTSASTNTIITSNKQPSPSPSSSKPSLSNREQIQLNASLQGAECGG